MAHNDNRYSVNSKLAAHAADILALQQAVKSVAAQKGDPGVRGCDGARGLTGAPGRDGVDGKPGKDAVGVRGADGMQGPRGIQGRRGEKGDTVVGPKGDSIVGPAGAQGIQGPPGKDCTMPTEPELADAVTTLRLKLAKWQAAILFAYEQNYGRTHLALKAAVDSVLKNIEQNAK